MRAMLAALSLCAAVAGTAASAPLDPSRLAAVAPPPFARAPMQAAFEDEHGRAVTLAELAGGRPLVLIPVQHGCANLCGLTLEDVRAAVARIKLRPGPDFGLVAFGIDPTETPAQADRSFERLGGSTGGAVSALVGNAGAVAAVTRALGYRYTRIGSSDTYAHMAAVAVLTADGRLVRWLPGIGVSSAGLQAALADAKRGEAGELGAAIRLLCFHFDPATGRYSLAVWRVVQLAGAGAALALAAALGFALWRERGKGAAA